MSLHISLNGKSLMAYHLTPMNGTIAALIKPAQLKSLVMNDNISVNGVRVLSAPTVRKKNKNEITLSFHISHPSLENLSEAIKILEEQLKNGINNTGVNELEVRELNNCFRLVFMQFTNISNYGTSGRAVLSIKFLEPDPSNRNV